jgi:hypothetical protein
MVCPVWVRSCWSVIERSIVTRRALRHQRALSAWIRRAPHLSQRAQSDPVMSGAQDFRAITNDPPFISRAQKYPEGTIVNFATKICQEQRGREGIESVWIEGLSSPKLYSQHTNYSIFNQSGVTARCGHPGMTWCHRDDTPQSNKQGTAKTSLQDDFAVDDCHFQASMWYLDISWVPFRLVQLSGWAGWLWPDWHL